MKKKLQRTSLILAALILSGTGLSACHPRDTQAANDDESALHAAGYARAPVITGVSQGDSSTFVVTGLASQDGRVRIVYQGNRATGVTADSNGRFRAEVPATLVGGVYDLSMDDNGRPMHADGRLFIPPGHPEKAVMLRSGSPSVPVANAGTVIAVIDIGGNGGAAVSGRAAAGAVVKLLDGGDLRGQVKSDSMGDYSVTTRIEPPTATPVTWTFTLQAGTTSVDKAVSVSLPAAAADQVSVVDGGWRVDWGLPGGGVQSTFVY